MKVKIGVVEKHYYTGVRQLEDIDLEKFPLIKQFMEVNPTATEEDLLKYLKKIKDKEFKKFLNELSWNELGWKPKVGITEGIEKTINYYLKKFVK